MAETIFGVLAERAATQPDAPAVLQKRYGRWTATSAAQLSRRIAATALGFRGAGIGDGDPVALILAPHEDRIVVDLALQLAGAQTSGLPTGATSAMVEHVLTDSGASTVVVQGQAAADVVLEMVEDGRVPAVRRILYIDPAGVQDYASELLGSLHDLVAAGEQQLEADPEAARRLAADLSPDAVAVRNYTSGTSGRPRGVLLTHANLMAASRATAERFGLGPEDRVLSFRPLSDPVELGATVLPALLTGALLVLPESRATVRQAMWEIAPTYLHLTPRYLKEIADDVRLRMQAARGLKGRILKRWHASLKRAVARGRMPSASRGSRFLVGHPVLEKLGLDKARWVVVSGATISREALAFFGALGLTIHPAYSMAELGGLVLCATGRQSGEDVTVGTPLPGVEARIVDGELQVRSAAAGRAYADAPDTPLADADGWVSTGDRAEERDGVYIVSGRADALLTTADGLTIAPQAVEAALRSSPYIREAVVSTEGDRTVAVLEPAAATLGRWASRRQLRYTTERSLLQLPEVGELLQRAVESAMARFHGLQLDEVRILEEPLTLSAGTLTHTDKVIPGAVLAAPTLGRPGERDPFAARRSEGAPVR